MKQPESERRKLFEQWLELYGHRYVRVPHKTFAEFVAEAKTGGTGQLDRNGRRV